MTVQGVAGARWLLRAVLVLAAGLVAVLLTSWFTASSAHVVGDPPPEAGDVAPVDDLAADATTPIAAPAVSLAPPRPSGPHGSGGTRPHDPLPAVASPPNVEHLRTQSTRDDSRPSGGPTVGLLPPAGTAAPSGGRLGMQPLPE